MLWFLKTFWRAISAVLFLLAILWLPLDIMTSGEALKPWRKIFAMVDQLTALKVFAVALVVWIAWLDARPTITRWREKNWPTKPKLVVAAEIIPSGQVREVIFNVSNEGMAADVQAELVPVSGPHFDGFYSRTPVAWRLHAGRSVHLIKSQTERFSAVTLDVPSGKFLIPYLGRAGVSHFSAELKLKEGRCQIVVMCRIISNPENADGVITKYLMVTHRIDKDGTSQTSASVGDDPKKMAAEVDKAIAFNSAGGARPQPPPSTATETPP